ncbi:MAG: right-handed parallel beta-helix repeat-containing protein [bacterium]|nr:right-handed parallel beta-helix repeat-containing protein [bacterium]
MSVKVMVCVVIAVSSLLMSCRLVTEVENVAALNAIVGETTYHVSVTGNNDADGLSLETAWRTIDYAVNTADADALVIVHEGDYRENSGGNGCLSFTAEMADLRLQAAGEVRILADGAVEQIVLLQYCSGFIEFDGFAFDGESVVERGIKANCGNKRFVDCRFRAVTDLAIEIHASSAVMIEDCLFGSPDQPLAAGGVYLNGSDDSAVRDCTFHTAGNSGDIVCCYATDDILIASNMFGSQTEPLHDSNNNWVVVVEDAQAPVIEHNTFHMLEGRCIRARQVYVDVAGIVIRNNVFLHQVLSADYSISVGREDPWGASNSSSLICGNILDIPTGDSTKHNIFVGYTLDPVIRDNVSHGGGFGLGIKGNDRAAVYHNSIYDCGRQGIVDKAGHDCEYYGNYVNNAFGECVRMTDDIYSGREVLDSYWHDNTLVAHPPHAAYCVDSPVDPVNARILCDDHYFELEESAQILLTYHGFRHDLTYVRSEFGWDLNSSLTASMEFPSFVDIGCIQPGPRWAKISCEMSEVCAGQLRYWSESREWTRQVEDPTMIVEFELEQLPTNTRIYYQAELIDLDGNSVLSPIASFKTGHRRKSKMHFTEVNSD